MNVQTLCNHIEGYYPGHGSHAPLGRASWFRNRNALISESANVPPLEISSGHSPRAHRLLLVFSRRSSLVFPTECWEKGYQELLLTPCLLPRACIDVTAVVQASSLSGNIGCD